MSYRYLEISRYSFLPYQSHSQGCLYTVADSSDEVFCFMENGDFPSQCLLGKLETKYTYSKHSKYVSFEISLF